MPAERTGDKKLLSLIISYAAILSSSKPAGFEGFGGFMNKILDDEDYETKLVKFFRHWRSKKIIRRKDGGVIALRIRRKK